MEQLIRATIRSEMARNNIRQKDLASSTGISCQTIKNQLHGRVSLKIDKFLIPVCDALKINIVDLFINSIYEK